MSELSLLETTLVLSSLVNCCGTTFFKCPLNPSAICLHTFYVWRGLSLKSSVEHPLAISLCHSHFALLFALLFDLLFALFRWWCASCRQTWFLWLSHWMKTMCAKLRTSTSSMSSCLDSSNQFCLFQWLSLSWRQRWSFRGWDSLVHFLLLLISFVGMLGALTGFFQ
jgi:hypothetical protein